MEKAYWPLRLASVKLPEGGGGGTLLPPPPQAARRKEKVSRTAQARLRTTRLRVFAYPE